MRPPRTVPLRQLSALSNKKPFRRQYYEAVPGKSSLREFLVDVGAPLSHAIIEQVYESALLVEGLHPEPASMITRIQEIMEAAVKRG